MRLPIPHQKVFSPLNQSCIINIHTVHNIYKALLPYYFMIKRSLFLDTFGDTPLLRVLEFFLTYPDFDYTKSYVAKETGVSRVTIEKIWKHLVKVNIITESRTLGKIEMWRLNKEHPKVKVLMQTVVRLSLSYLESLKAKSTRLNS